MNSIYILKLLKAMTNYCYQKTMLSQVFIRVYSFVANVLDNQEIDKNKTDVSTILL